MYFLFILLFASQSFANVMNLNEYMPTQLEDTSVTEVHKVEVQGSVRYVDENQDVILAPNVRYGVYNRVQLEYNSDFITTEGSKNEPLSEHQLGLQWKFNDQDDWVPSLAIHPHIIYPAGYGSRSIDEAVKFLLTYTLFGTIIDPIGQFHLNYQWTHNSDRLKEENKVGKQLVFGYSHKIDSQDVLVADFLHQKEVYSSEFDNALELGWLHEFSEGMFLGLGVGLDTKLGKFSSNLSGQISF